MKSQDYRNIVTAIVRQQINKSLPGAKLSVKQAMARAIGIAVHARMYGADVDGVASPLFYDIYPERLPTIPATELAERATADGPTAEGPKPISAGTD